MGDSFDIPFEEKIEIAKEFIKYAPPGEFPQVYNDVSVILNKNLSEINSIPQQAMDYHTDQLTTIFIDEENQNKMIKFNKLQSDGQSVLKNLDQKDVELFEKSNGNTFISSTNYVSGNTFYDIKTNKIFDFDPITQEISNIKNADISISNQFTGQGIDSEMRIALSNSLTQYVEAHYPKGICLVVPSKDKPKNFIFLIEDHEFQPQNRWNGKWRSEWLASIGENDNKIILTGGAKVHVHYYEDSNVQLVTKQVYNGINIEGISASDKPEDIAEGIVKVLKKLETRYQQSLRDNYVTMDDTIFKTLRRKLPIQKTKFNWDNINASRVGKLAGQAKQ